MFKKIFFFIGLLVTISINLNAINYEFKCVAEKALKEKKLLLISVVNENCYYCNKMDKDVFENKRVIRKINKHFERIKIVSLIEEVPKFLQVEAYPTNFIVDPKTFNVIDEFIGYLSPKEFIEVIEMVYKLEVSHKNIENE